MKNSTKDLVKAANQRQIPFDFLVNLGRELRWRSRKALRLKDVKMLKALLFEKMPLLCESHYMRNPDDIFGSRLLDFQSVLGQVPSVEPIEVNHALSVMLLRDDLQCIYHCVTLYLVLDLAQEQGYGELTNLQEYIQDTQQNMRDWLSEIDATAQPVVARLHETVKNASTDLRYLRAISDTYQWWTDF